MKFSIFFLALFFSFSVLAEIKTITVDEYKIEYEIRGTGKATIFLEAGGSAGLNDWDPIFNALAKNARTIRYSRVGNGNSSSVKRNYSSEEYAIEAHALLKELNIKGKVVYVAHSYGAYIARIFASKYPEKMAALMLIEPASEHDVDIMRRIDLKQAELEIAQVKVDDMKNGMSNQYLDFWSKRPLPDYPEIPDIPVTVIASVKKYEDPPLLFFTDEARNMWGKLHTQWAESFPKGKTLLTKKSYHYPQKDEPQMVIKEIVELVNRTYEH
jgi:pimeloyl-ACP methyl ester carboxylesterase